MKLYRYLYMLAFCLIVQSCMPTAKIEIDVNFSNYYRNYLEEKKGIKESNLKKQRGKTVLIHPILTEAESFQSYEKYLGDIKTFIQGMGLYKDVLVLDDIESQFDADTQEIYTKYIDTYRYSHISNLEFTKILLDQFNIDSVLYFQVDAWPCENCLNQNLVQMNFTLVNTYSGNIIWLAVDGGFTAEDRDNLPAVGNIVKQVLFNSFYLSFRELPHLQYKNALLTRSDS